MVLVTICVARVMQIDECNAIVGIRGVYGRSMVVHVVSFPRSQQTINVDKPFFSYSEAKHISIDFYPIGTLNIVIQLNPNQNSFSFSTSPPQFLLRANQLNCFVTRFLGP